MNKIEPTNQPITRFAALDTNTCNSDGHEQVLYILKK